MEVRETVGTGINNDSKAVETVDHLARTAPRI